MAAETGWVYSSSNPSAIARMALMSNTLAPLGVSFCRPYVSLPSWPQLPPANVVRRLASRRQLQRPEEMAAVVAEFLSGVSRRG
ncbi:hypothetical protein [Dactylosporangium sp. NPDC050588]|uniref:hypothetical protein n=1 Tax=Dactylosporangium sp. NPDC050588 TaxID=3157211 RepID=UPI0033C12B2D